MSAEKTAVAATDMVTEDPNCAGTIVPSASISSPIGLGGKWLKFGGVEMRFSENIDFTSKTGKLVLQLKESLISEGIEFVQSGLLPRYTGIDNWGSYPRVIQVGLSNWLGSHSDNPGGPFDHFHYYDNLQTNLNQWHVCHTPSEPHTFLISNDLGYHWSFDERNKRVFLQQDYRNQEFVRSNWFYIDHNTGSISPYCHRNRLYVYGYRTPQDSQPSLFLPVRPQRFEGDELKISTDYNDDDDKNTYCPHCDS